MRLASELESIYRGFDNQHRRRLLNLVLSNCVVTAGKVHYSYRKPFDMLAEGSVSANWLGS